MTNPFTSRSSSLAGPGRDIFPIVPDDTAVLPDTAVSLYVETGGTLRFVTVSGQTRTVDVSGFSILPVGVVQVLDTGTTAEGIHGFSI